MCIMSLLIYFEYLIYVCFCLLTWFFFSLAQTLQFGAVDAEIKVPSVENTELKASPFKALSRSVYSHTWLCLLPGISCLFLPFWSIHLHLFQNRSWVFPVLAVANTGSCVGPQNEKGYPARCRFLWWVLAEYKIGSKTSVIVFLVLGSEIVDRIWTAVWEKRLVV